jgi:hypothetical protein
MRKFNLSWNAILFAFFFVLSFIVNAQTNVFNEDFEGTLQVTPTGVPAWSVNTTVQVSGLNSYHAVVGMNSVSYFETNTINLTGYSNVSLEFNHICKVQFGDSARIFVSVNDGLTWQVIPHTTYLGTGIYYLNNLEGFSAASYAATWLPGNNAAAPDNTWWKNEKFDISSIVANQSQVKFRFYLKDGNQDGANLNAGWFIDDVKVIGAFSELIPPTITFVPPLLQDTVYSAGPFAVNATITDASGISYAKLFYKINTLPWDSVTMINTTGSNYMGEIPGQPYNTEFEYYVIAKDASPALNQAQSVTKAFVNKKPAPIYTIGTGSLATSTTGVTPYTSFYEGVRKQYLIRASELIALGVSAGPLLSLAFDVTVSGPGTYPQLNYTIKMGHTANTEINGNYGTISGNWTVVYTNASEPAPPVGWKTHTFSTPFMWNGSSNILIDICHENDPNNTCSACYSTNSTVKYTETTFPSVYGRYNDNAPACNVSPSSAIGTADYNKRPNMRITTSPNTNDYDAGIVQITEPTGVVLTSNPVDVKVRFKNYGIQTLTSLDIGWSVNGVSQTPYSWTGTLLEDVTSGIIQLGSATFALGTNEIRAWTSQPNGLTDQNFLNDTMTAYVYGCDNILSGIFTIDSAFATSGTNFQSFEDAMMALTNCGVSGPVVFNVAPGIYNTRLLFTGLFPGASATNTITFQGSVGTVIRYSTTVTDQRAAILLNGAKYLRFDQLTVTIPTASTFGQGFQLINNAEDIQITNCTINTDIAGTLTNFAGIVASGSLTSATTVGNSAHNVLIENNIVNGGYYGIILYGGATTPLNNIIIKNNKVNNSYYYGIRVNYVNGAIIDENEISLRVAGGTTVSYALYLQYDYQAFNINRNNIKNSGGYGIYVANCTPPPGPRSLMSNNSVGGFTSTGTPYGIYLTACSGIDIFYNSVNVNTGTGRGLYTLATATGLSLLNNTFVFSGTGAGYAVYHSSTASVIEQDYNNYFSSGTNFVYHGANRVNLAALQAVNQPPGNDVNSVSGDPLYISVSNLMPIGAVLDNVGTPIPSLDIDIEGNPRDPSTPDIGAYEYTPVAADIGLIDAKLVRGACLSTNDSLYLKLRNVIGSPVDLSGDPVYATYTITGPVASTFSLSINNGILNPNQTVEFGFDGIDMSIPGVYILSVYIEPGSSNLMAINDTLNNIFQITVAPETFDAVPDYVLVMSSTTTVPLTVNSNLFPGGGFIMTEICHFKYPPGEPVGGWPAYLLADDYIEISGVPNSDLAGHTLEQWSTTALLSTHTFAPGKVLSPNGTAIIAVGQMGSSVEVPSNYYYHGNGGYTGSFGSTGTAGRILKNPNGDIIDAVVYGTFTFPAAAGVTPADWSGNTPALSGSGNRLNGPYTKTSVNWAAATDVVRQDPNILNPGVVLPQSNVLTDFSWSLDGIITSENSIDTIVGPWTSNGIYQYVASYISPCGLKTDTVTIEVGVPTHDLRISEILEPQDNICTNGTEYVSIVIDNFGIDTLFGGFTASYSIDNGPPVTENVSLSVPPAGSVVYDFVTPITMLPGSPTQADSTFWLKVWATAATDPYHFNDTLAENRTFGFNAETPVVQGATVVYGAQAELIASSSAANHFWFTDSLSTSHIYIGDTLTTPPLFNDATYWVESRNSPPPINVQLGTGTLTTSATAVTPYSSLWEGVRLQYLIRASELTALGVSAGNISSMAFNVTASGPGTYPQLNFTIKMAHTTGAELTSDYGTPSGPWNIVYTTASEPAPL